MSSMSLEFCPNCANLLEIEAPSGGRKMRFFCPTCPYICPINSKIVYKEILISKEMEPIFNVADEMKNAPKTQASCPRCHHGEVYCKQIQIRPADEPMTIFYTCCNDSCRHGWHMD